MSKVSSIGSTSGIVRSIVCVETVLPSTLNMPVPPRPRPLKLLKASIAKPRPSYLKSYSSVCLPGNSASAPSQRTHVRLSRFHTDTGLPLYHPQLPRSPVGAYAALVAGGSYSARRATGGTAPACSLPLIGRRGVIGIVVASCRG